MYRLLRLAILIFIPAFAGAQNFHFSARFGVINYQGDLKAKSIALSGASLMGSIGGRYDLAEHVTARSYITYGKLKADDKKGTAAMRQRNLNFATSLLDWELTAQYNLFSLNNRWWTPYAFAGIGLYHYKPYTKDPAGERVFLKPLSTEGQGFTAGREEYKLTQFSVPFGLGADYSLNEDMRVGLEFGYRKLFNDYLDDVSNAYVDASALQAARGAKAVELAWRGDEVNSGPYPPAGATRGNPDNKDGYYYVALTFTVRYFFDKYKEIAGLPSGGRSKRVGCPASRGY